MPRKMKKAVKGNYTSATAKKKMMMKRMKTKMGTAAYNKKYK